MLAVNKAKLKDDTVTFLRVNNYTGTFRQRAMMMMNQARKNFFFEEDQDGRVFKENRLQRGDKGKPQFDPLKVNPHRVQMFSINEIWHCVSRRLGELGVMHDPDEKSQKCIDSDSEQLDDDFDFREAIESRIDSVFTGKNMGQVPLTQILKPNDYKLLKRALQITATNDKLCEQNDYLIQKHHKESEFVRTKLNKFEGDVKEETTKQHEINWNNTNKMDDTAR